MANLLPNTFILRIEPINSEIPAFNAKATVVSSGDPDLPHPSHPIALPGDPWWGTGIPPIDPPPTPPEAILVWAWVPEASRWVQGWMRADGMQPKDDECNPPAPPAMTLVWIFVPEVQRWVQGYVRTDQGGPKQQKPGGPQPGKV